MGISHIMVFECVYVPVCVSVRERVHRNIHGTRVIASVSTSHGNEEAKGKTGSCPLHSLL